MDKFSIALALIQKVLEIDTLDLILSGSRRRLYYSRRLD